jgi:arsenate reductase-like glutaredoxin family protein
MSVEKAIALLKEHGITVSVKQVKLKRPAIRRINELLTLDETVVVTHSGKRATVFTLDGYRRRVRGGRRALASRWGKKKATVAAS